MNYNNRQEGIKRAKKVIKANSNWRHSFNTLIKTRVPCSCMMCGNRRKWDGETRQEKIHPVEME